MLHECGNFVRTRVYRITALTKSVVILFGGFTEIPHVCGNFVRRVHKITTLTKSVAGNFVRSRVHKNSQ